MKRCPGCAGNELSVNIKRFAEEYAVECSCGWRGPCESSHDRAIESWDKRKIIVDMDKPEKNWAPETHRTTEKP